MTENPKERVREAKSEDRESLKQEERTGHIETAGDDREEQVDCSVDGDHVVCKARRASSASSLDLMKFKSKAKASLRKANSEILDLKGKLADVLELLDMSGELRKEDLVSAIREIVV